jgi:hypothetical protein
VARSSRERVRLPPGWLWARMRAAQVRWPAVSPRVPPLQIPYERDLVAAGV